MNNLSQIRPGRGGIFTALDTNIGERRELTLDEINTLFDNSQRRENNNEIPPPPLPPPIPPPSIPQLTIPPRFSNNKYGGKKRRKSKKSRKNKKSRKSKKSKRKY